MVFEVTSGELLVLQLAASAFLAGLFVGMMLSSIAGRHLEA